MNGESNYKLKSLCMQATINIRKQENWQNLTHFDKKYDLNCHSNKWVHGYHCQLSVITWNI